MILTCPACATSYFIPDDALGANGRKVRCKSCGEVWRASPDEPLELSVAPEPRVISAPEPEAVAERLGARLEAEGDRRLEAEQAEGGAAAVGEGDGSRAMAGKWRRRDIHRCGLVEAVR
jgi:predicted Zn finger-like uncharacterized protein